MAASKLISAFQADGSLSSNSKVLTDSVNVEFAELMKRWTDYDKKTPSAIVMPATEGDIAKIIKLAVEAGVPFVPKAGGHTAWSSIGREGFILDLSLMRGVEVDKQNALATIQAGARIQDVHKATYLAGFCGALGSGNTVGAIPSSISGGLSALAPLVGFGSDNIVSARLVTAKGEVVNVSESENTELLYALKGAGQFFGVVASLKITIHPLSILGTPGSTVWTGTFIFSAARTVEVATTLSSIQKISKKSAGLMIISCPPPAFQPCLIVAVFFLGTGTDAEAEFRPLIDLKPDIMYQGADVAYENINDSMDMYCATGDYKAWAGAGLFEFKPADMGGMLERYTQLVEKCPDAKATGYAVEWCSEGRWNDESAVRETAFAHRDVNHWVELLNWHSNLESRATVAEMAADTLAFMRRNQSKDEHCVYQGWTRADPVEWRYRGDERLERLKGLKRKWDPKGVFTREFL